MTEMLPLANDRSWNSGGDAFPANNIGDLRNNIDDIDNQIALLLARRFDITEQIGEVKGQQNRKRVGDPIREFKVMERLGELTEDSALQKTSLYAIYNTIFSESKRQQEDKLPVKPDNQLYHHRGW